ncbi:MAG TPA: hypothetical protein VGR40_10525 [Candidatus Binatus sp.]|nr:hypothetical protein [Candidatus Binatus sp.]
MRFYVAVHPRAASLAAFGLVLMLSWSALASADPTPRYFVGNFIGNDATVENYLSVSGGVDRAQNFESLYLEKTISSCASFSLFVGYQRLEQEGEVAALSGFTNLGVGYKHLLLSLPANEFLLTINPTLELPVGDSSVSETHARAGGDVLFQKGFGDLPESLGWLRPGGVEGDSGFESKVTGARDDLVSADLEIEYSLDYLDRSAAGSVPGLMRNLTPHLDFDYAQYLSAHNNSSAPDFELTPAIAWMNDTFEVNLGAQIALNHASSGTGAVAFVWLLGVSYDQLVPALGRNLFR